MKKSLLFFISIFIKILTSISGILNSLSINFAYLKNKSNIFCSFLNTKKFLIKKKFYEGIEIKTSVSSWWDLHRINNFKDYPVRDIFFEKKFKKKIIFLEIGANTGMASLLVAKKFKNSKVYSLEFEPNTFLTLTQNIQINNLTNIVPICFGLAKKISKKKFYYNLKYSFFNDDNSIQSGCGGHSITFDKINHNKKFFFNAIFTNYDALTNALNLEVPTHIFIDAHGAEKEIILGMINTLYKKNVYKVYIDTEEVKKLDNLWVYKKMVSLGFELSYHNTTKYYNDLKSTSLVFKKTRLKKY